MSGSGPRTREAHVAFPGGKTEEGDEGGMYTGSFCSRIRYAMSDAFQLCAKHGRRLVSTSRRAHIPL